jgi:hypothetical protein
MGDIFGNSPKRISHMLGIISFRVTATYAEVVKQLLLFRSWHLQAELFAPEVLTCVQTCDCPSNMLRSSSTRLHSLTLYIDFKPYDKYL